MRMRSRTRTGAIAAVGLCLALVGGGHALGALNFVTKWGSSGTGDGQFQVPQNVAVDGAGNVFVADQNNNRIQKFTGDGAFILKWGSFGSGNGQLGSPQGVAVDPAGNVYVADTGNYRVQKFTSSGGFVQQIGTPSPTPNNPGPGEFAANPHSLALGPNGDLYVTESSRVLEFTAAGGAVRAWGSQGSGPGQFNSARGIVVDPAGNVYVADAGNSRVEKFTAAGAFVSSFGSAGSGPGQFASPYALAIAPNGHIFVGDIIRNSIDEFGSDATFVERNLSAGGENFRPQGLAFDGAGDLYVTDNQANTGNRLFKLHPSAAAPAPLPPPQVGVNVNVAVESGTVLVKLPPGVVLPRLGAHAAAGGFVPLTKAAQIPTGSLVDTTHGQLAMTAAAGTTGGLAKGSFSSGQFKIVQKRAVKAVTELQLSQPLACGKARSAGGAHAAARSRRLFSNVSGRFRTRGRYSTATVRGTQWLMKDTCTSTLTQVRAGTVVVSDLLKHKTVTVRKGGKYLAHK